MDPMKLGVFTREAGGSESGDVVTEANGQRELLARKMKEGAPKVEDISSP